MSLCPCSDQSQDVNCPRQCHDLDLSESLKGLRAEGHWQTAFLDAVVTTPSQGGTGWPVTFVEPLLHPRQSLPGLVSALSHLILLQPRQIDVRMSVCHTVKRSLKV